MNSSDGRAGVEAKNRRRALNQHDSGESSNIDVVEGHNHALVENDNHVAPEDRDEAVMNRKPIAQAEPLDRPVADAMAVDIIVR